MSVWWGQVVMEGVVAGLVWSCLSAGGAVVDLRGWSWARERAVLSAFGLAGGLAVLSAEWSVV